MELAFLVWAVTLLQPISTSLGLFGSLLLAGTCIYAFGMWIYNIECSYRNTKYKFRYKTAIAIFLAGWTFVFASHMVPTEKTAYLMIGAYAAQKIAEAPKTQELGGEVLKILELKIKHYAAEAEKEAIENLNKVKK